MGTALYRNVSFYTRQNRTFHVVEMLALVSQGHGMAVSTTDWRTALTWNGSQLNFQTTLRVPDTVDS